MAARFNMARSFCHHKPFKAFFRKHAITYFEAAIKKCQGRPDDDNEWVDNLTSLIENQDLS